MQIYLIIKPIDDGDKISEDQKLFQSGIGMIIYLMKHSIANTTWELPKVMDDTNPEVFLKMQHMIKYALDRKILGSR